MPIPPRLLSPHHIPQVEPEVGMQVTPQFAYSFLRKDNFYRRKKVLSGKDFFHWRLTKASFSALFPSISVFYLFFVFGRRKKEGIHCLKIRRS